MIELADSPATATLLLLAAAGVIAIAGSRLARTADQLADASGLGEAVLGGVFLGGVTSAAGLVTSITAAAAGHPALAVSNAVGGIAVQTAFLGVADLAYTRANLEHAAASLENVMQAVLLVVLLSIPLVAGHGPEVAVGGIHPATPILLLAYVFGLRLATETGRVVPWSPRRTDVTHRDEPDPGARSPTNSRRLWGRFAMLGGVVAVAGWAVAHAGVTLAREAEISETVVGLLGTAVITSLPELVTAVAAVRHGAPTLAVGDIVGGNTFDVLTLAAADCAYRGGSIYHAGEAGTPFVLSLTVLLTGVLLLGLLRRQKHGPANIGFESVLLLAIYAAACGVLLWAG